MLGAIIGDIAGSRFEFNPTNDYNFEFFIPDCAYTDDTICTIAVADALLNNRLFGDSIHNWCQRYPNPMGGYGLSFRKWVKSNNPEPYNSFGNGAAMRVSPVAHWFDNEAEVLEAAALTALPTHNHSEGIKGAQTVALAIFKAMQLRRHQKDPALYVDDILSAGVQFSGYNINMPKAAVLNRFDETCQGTVPVALKIISLATSFEDAVRLAVSLGADADTLGAIVGSIAEAIWGIPISLRLRVEDYLPEDMKRVLDKFFIEKEFSYKPLIDTIYSGTDFAMADWDLLSDIEDESVIKRSKQEFETEKAAKRRLMAERGKARKNW